MTEFEKQAYWEAHLVAIAQEGISTQAYAKRESLSVAALYSWRSRLKSQQHGPQLAPRAGSVARPKRLFAPVAIQDVQTQTNVEVGACALSLGPGIRLELPMPPNPQWLACHLSAYRRHSVFGVMEPRNFRHIGASKLSAYRRQQTFGVMEPAVFRHIGTTGQSSRTSHTVQCIATLRTVHARGARLWHAGEPDGRLHLHRRLRRVSWHVAKPRYKPN